MRLVLQHEDRILGQPAHAPEQDLAIAVDELRPTGQVRVEALDAAIVERQHVVLRRLDEEQPLQVGQLLGLFRREVVRLRPVVRPVQLPDVAVDRRHLGHHPGRRMAGDRRPALVVDAAVDEHLEVLRRVPVGGRGVVERVRHRHALERRLLDPVDEGRRGQAGGLEDRRRNIDDVVELVADLALRLDAVGPGHDRAVARAAPVAGNLLGPLVGRVHRVGPADRVVVVRLGRAEQVDLGRHELGRLELTRAVEDEQLVERPRGVPSADAPLSPMMQ